MMHIIPAPSSSVKIFVAHIQNRESYASQEKSHAGILHEG